ncbi:MAG: ABC transporter ATP-binding protein [Clostridia bacterium]|nr:ABC transporter ATP-binding protein [Clostridia bacterium]
MKNKNIKSDGVVKRIIALVFPYRIQLVFSLVFAAAYVALSLFAPIVSGRAVDAMVTKNTVDFDAVFRYAVIYACVVVGASVCQWLMTHLTNIITYKTVLKLRRDLFYKITDLSVGYIDSHAHGDILSRVINDVEQLSDGLLMGFSQLFTGILTIAATIGFMISINIPIALVVVVFTPLSLFVASFIAKNTYSMFKKQSEIRGDMTSLIEESIGGAKTVNVFGRFDETAEKIAKTGEELRKCGVRALFFSSITNPATRFVNNAVYAAVAILGAFSAIKGGGITVGQLSSFLMYANQYTKPFNEISGVIAEFVGAKASAERIFDLLDEKSVESSLSGNKIPEKAQDIDFSSVSFSYSPEKPLIEDFCLSVPYGKMIAIVGPTGCGKTTLINLLLRFYDVNSGEIRLGGVPVKELELNSLRRSFGMVLQDTWLKNGTVAENIAYGRKNATREEIVAAAVRAHADGFISSLENGYDTVINEDGDNLSQGQKQMLCISRVMLSLPPMLILDEATSSIDTMTELRIRRAFDEMTEGRTSFVVAHRLSTITKADLVLVMKNGKIVEKGTHEKLLESGGFYKTLYESQFETE